MNQTIVKNSVKNFIENTQVNSTVLQEACEELLWRSVREVRNEDPFLYEEMTDRSTLAQTRLLEQRLEMELVDIEEVVQTIGNSVLKAFEKSLELNEYVGDEYSDDYCQVVLEDCVNFIVLDENLLTTVGKWGQEQLVDLAKWLGRIILSVAPTVAAIKAASVASSIAGMFLVNCLVFIIVLVVATVSLNQLGVNIQKQMIEAFRGFVNLMGSLAKLVKKGSERFKHIYDITYNNEEKCYRKAGLDPKKLGLRQMLSIKEGALTRILLILNEKDKIDALRNCFLESYLDRISIFFDLYFECLRKTGNWNSVRNMSDDKFITMFQMKGGLYPACDQFRDSAVQAVNTYQDLIDHLFANDPAKRSQWLILLNRYILDKRDSQDNIKRDFNNQQKKPGFTDKKYQRLGRGLDNSEEIYDPDLKTK